MPAWATVTLIVVGTLLLLAGVTVAAIFSWRAYVRRLLLRLVVRAEAIEAVGQALVETVTRLSQGDDAALTDFADDSESSERRALHEVASRAQMLGYELDRIPMPQPLVFVAEALADAAVVVDREASRIQDPLRGEAAFDALTSVDLESVRAYMKSARVVLNEACLTHGLEDRAVYGGGLYL